LNYLDTFWGKTQIPNFIKIRLLVADLFHVDAQAGLMKRMVAFYNFANVRKNKRGCKY
jgi:hypothetical protein